MEDIEQGRKQRHSVNAVVPFNEDSKMNSPNTTNKTPASHDNNHGIIGLFRKMSQASIPKENSHGDGVTLKWSNIKYTVTIDKSGQTKDVLSNLAGTALPGELLAIMGTSGAGKSTLLDVLAGRLDSDGLSGEITTNGLPINKSVFRKESGYVMQSDALFPLLTVRETFQYAAYLRVHNKTTAEKKEIANKIIQLLRLERCADTAVGNDKIRGISGGEKRRVSIGVDIIHQPRVIFLDEPTSGLDSSTAYAVIDSLKSMALETKCTILMTIHQPSARLYELIDKVVFLCQGKTTYFGEAAGVLPYIYKVHENLNLGRPRQANPPELFLDLSDYLVENKQIDVLFNVYKRSEKIITNNTLDKAVTIHYANSLLGDIFILSQRALTNIIRTKELFLTRLGSTVFFSVLAATLFLHPEATSQGLTVKASYFVLSLAYFFWTSLEALPIFFEEREIFQREYSGGSYRALAYAVSSSIVYYPFLFVIGLSYTAISWWLVNLPNDIEIFLFQILLIFVVLIAGSTFATMISVLAPDAMTGQTLGSAAFSVMFLFSGFFVPSSQIPKYWIFFYYFSLFKYGMDGQLVNGLKDFHTATMTNDQILHYYGVDKWNKWYSIGVLIAWILFYRSIFYYRLITSFNGSRKG